MTPITTNEALAEFCARVSSAPFITVDTEFMRETTYWPRLCLIQAASADHAAIIDPMADANRDGQTVIAGASEPGDDKTLMPGDHSADAAVLEPVSESDATIVNEGGQGRSASETATLGANETEI